MTVLPVTHRFENREAASSVQATVSMNVDGDDRVRMVEDLRSLVDARSLAVVAVPAHDDGCAERFEVTTQVGGDSPGEPRLGVAAVGLRTCGVAVLILPPVPHLV